MPRLTPTLPAIAAAVLLAACGTPAADRSAGEANESYQFTIDSTGLSEGSPYTGVGFDWELDACQAIGNPESCGTTVGYATISGDVLTLSGPADNTLAASVFLDGVVTPGGHVANPYGGEIERTVCGNLYPISEDGPMLAAGAATCIGQAKDGPHNPWVIGGIAGGPMYGWGQTGDELFLNFEDWQIPLAMTSRDTVAIGKQAITKATPTNLVNLTLRQGTPETGPTITNFTFTDNPDAYSISTGQPWGGITGQGGTDVYTISVLASRHRTTPVANWFNTETSSNSIVTTSNIDTTTPSQLNFAFCGTLTVTFNDTTTREVPLCLGQGHADNPTAFVGVGETGNNWWAGSNEATVNSCLFFTGPNIALSPPKDLKEGTDRNNTFYLMPADNPGTYGEKTAEVDDGEGPTAPPTPVTFC